jgi:hypothetical protein
MVAETAFKRLKACTMQFTEVVFQKIAPLGRIFIESKPSFTAFKCRGEHSESPLRGDFQHHAVPITCINCLLCLLHSPPARTPAIPQAYLASARLGGRILLG